MVTKEVKRLDKFCLGIQHNVDVILAASRTLIEDIRAFHKDYEEEMKLKKEYDENTFRGNKNSLTSFHDRLLKFNVQTTTSISEEQITTIVSSIDSCFKTHLALMLDLVLQLPTNAPRLSMLVSQGGIRVVHQNMDMNTKVK